MMDAGLRGKSALVTGGGTGIGRAIALALADAGANVALASNQPAEETIRKLKSHGVRASFISADVSIEADVQRMVDKAASQLGSIDLYVNNAAIADHQPVTRISADAWHRTLNTNLSACVFACREICKLMIAQGGGSILIIGSTAQYNQAYGEASYHIAKAGLRTYKNTLALEMAPHGIRVNMLVPGHFLTPLTEGIGDESASILRGEIPLRRFGGPQELTATALLLLSDRLSPYTTGAEFVVDGGLSLRPLPLVTDEQILLMNRGE
ncbi:MAG: SDR family oxidoreductase [Chloroflexi bacterium]|nr:SDR family oxidoreductase [Chloroflexota bacterium]